MSKQKIREWLVENYNKLADMETADIIDQYTKDQSAWVSVDIEPKESCTAWYAKDGYIVGVYQFYVCQEYGNEWINSELENAFLEGGHYMIIDEPLPPTQEA